MAQQVKEKVMNKFKEVEATLGDHPNVSADQCVNPTTGTGTEANQGHDAGKSAVQNRIQAGQGSERPEETIKAGSTTSPDTVSAATTGGIPK